MLHYVTSWDDVKGYNICSLTEIFISVYDYLIALASLYHSYVGCTNDFHELSSVLLLSFMDKVISNVIFKKLKRQSSPVKP